MDQSAIQLQKANTGADLQKVLRGRDDRNAVGTEKCGFGRGFASTEPTQGSRERRKLPQCRVG